MNGSRQVTFRKHRDGFTEELDVIINYDIKYRMEKELAILPTGKVDRIYGS